jgi:threonine/homoserine/homoserine lactone efflux protein
VNIVESLCYYCEEVFLLCHHLIIVSSLFNRLAGFISVVVAVVASIFLLKLVLSQNKAFIVNGLETASIIAALANAIQIQVMNIIYGGVAIQLTDYENHRTDTQYEDSLISKTFVFQFVNSYASLFYIAFFKPFLAEDPCIGSCMHELQANLGTIFLTRLAIGNLTEVGIPSVQSYLKSKEGTKGVEGEVSEVEKTFFMVSIIYVPAWNH